MRWLPDEDTRRLFIQYLRWREIEQYIKDGYETAVFAVGATEQHGPHLPELVDELIGTEYALGVAKGLGFALVAPTIRPGISLQHMDFAGTIALRHETLNLLVEDYVYSLLRHGFRRFVLISSHFGNRPSIQVICQELQATLGERALIIPLFQPGLYLPSGERFSGLSEGFHANNFETALMLHLAPELVDLAQARPDGKYPDTVDRLIARNQAPVGAFSESGVLGHPERADAEIGRDAFEAIVAGMVEEVARLSSFLREHPRLGVEEAH